MWTKAQQAEANAQGWGVFVVVMEKEAKPQVLPLQFTDRMPHSTAMLNLIITQAKVGDKLCLAALRHITQSNSKPAAKKKP